jgi:hypothetical protein
MVIKIKKQEQFMRKKKKKPKKTSKPKKIKGKLMFGIIFSIIIVVLGLGFFGGLNLGRKSETVYEGDLIITEPLGEGYIIPNFGVERGDLMIVTIKDFYSSHNYSLMIALQGAGVDWRKVCTKNSMYRRSFDISSVYNLELAINSLMPSENASISFYLRVTLA